MSTQTPGLRARIINRIVHGRDWRARLQAAQFGWRSLRGQPPRLELYYEAGDAHSHLCASWLRANRERLRGEVVVRVVGEPDAALYPEADRQRQFALSDATRLAACLSLPHDLTPALPEAPARRQAAAALADASDLGAWLAREQAVAAALFAGRDLPCGPVPDAQARLEANAARRRRLGHYLPAMWQFDGEWFWGLDRMHHLQQRLARHALLTEPDTPLVHADPAHLPVPPVAAEAPLEFFFSFRSPYSYLAAERLQATLSANDLGRLVIRPVLPMVMRGLPVPRAKRMYIARDAAREAAHLGIPFGLIADPVGAGAQRTLSACPVARDAEQLLAFLCSAARGAWSEGIDLATDPGLRQVCERVGMDWNAVREALASPTGLDQAAANRERLFDLGLWGVPSFRLGEFTTWGQDRLWMIEELLRRKGNPE